MPGWLSNQWLEQGSPLTESQAGGGEPCWDTTVVPSPGQLERGVPQMASKVRDAPLSEIDIQIYISTADTYLHPGKTQPVHMYVAIYCFGCTCVSRCTAFRDTFSEIHIFHFHLLEELLQPAELVLERLAEGSVCRGLLQKLADLAHWKGTLFFASEKVSE